jgi:hypothetical protein
MPLSIRAKVGLALGGILTTALVIFLVVWFTGGNKSNGVKKEPTPWTCLDGTPTPLRKNTNGDVECMSLNAHDCMWGKTINDCQSFIDKNKDVAGLKPLTCGAMHKDLYQVTGYDTQGHWCKTGQEQIH